MIKDFREELVARISTLMVQERSLRHSPFSAVAQLYRDALDDSLTSDDQAFFRQRIEQQLLLSALSRRESLVLSEELWRSTTALGYENEDRHASFAVSVAAIALRNGWTAFASLVLDELEHLVPDIPQPLLDHISGFRTKIGPVH